MGKTNFTKVETSLEEGLRKMEVERLLQEASKVSHTTPIAKETAPQLTKEQNKLLRTLELNLIRLRSKDSKIFTKLKVKRSTIQKMIRESTHLTPEDWKHLATLLKKTKIFIKEMLPDKVDDKLVESEKERHINKRFNVNEKWLPLK